MILTPSQANREVLGVVDPAERWLGEVVEVEPVARLELVLAA